MALTLLFCWFPRLRAVVTSLFFKEFRLPPVQTKRLISITVLLVFWLSLCAPDDCADPTIMSDCPDSSCVNFSCLTPLLYPSVPIQARFPVLMALTLLFCWFPRLRAVVTSLFFKEFRLPPVQTKRHHSPLFHCLQMMLALEFVRLWPLLMT